MRDLLGLVSKRLSVGSVFGSFLGFAAILAVWMLWPTIAAHVVWPQASKITGGNSTTLSAYGQMGDMFGSLNALFAGLAFLGVGIAAYYQQQTFRAQQRQLQEATDQLKMQAFEPLFFQLLSLFREMQAGAKITLPEWDIADQHWSSSDVQNHLEGVIYQAVSEPRGQPLRQTVDALYGEIYERNSGDLGPMFRTLYHIFKLISRSGLTDQVQVRYANIARGLLSEQFLRLLMMNCLSAPGEQFKPYVEYFGLLKHSFREHADLHLVGAFDECAVLPHSARLQRWGGKRPVLPD